jgi:hypothetical protein
LKQKPKWELKDEDYCTYKGVKYVPSAYILTFDADSKPIHLCQLVDVNANSTITVKLKDVMENET